VQAVKPIQHMKSKSIRPWQGISVAVLIAAAAATHANEFLDLSVSTGYEDNVSRGLASQNIDGSFFLTGLVETGKLFQIGSNSTLAFGTSLGISNFPNLSGFNRVELGVSVSAQHKFGLGAYSPRVGAVLSANRDFLQGDERDRDLYAWQLTVAKRFSPAWSGEVGISRETSRGAHERPVDFTALPYIPGITRPTDPFDHYNNLGFVSVAYDFISGWLLTLSYQTIDGYIVPSALPPAWEMFLESKAVALDPAYGQRQVLYLLKSETDALSASLSIPIAQDTALDFTMSQQEIAARQVGDYRNWSAFVTVIHRF
jgi:hypothetical protein